MAKESYFFYFLMNISFFLQRYKIKRNICQTENTLEEN